MYRLIFVPRPIQQINENAVCAQAMCKNQHFVEIVVVVVVVFDAHQHHLNAVIHSLRCAHCAKQHDMTAPNMVSRLTRSWIHHPIFCHQATLSRHRVCLVPIHFNLFRVVSALTQQDAWFREQGVQVRSETKTPRP